MSSGIQLVQSCNYHPETEETSTIKKINIFKGRNIEPQELIFGKEKKNPVQNKMSMNSLFRSRPHPMKLSSMQHNSDKMKYYYVMSQYYLYTYFEYMHMYMYTMYMYFKVHEYIANTALGQFLREYEFNMTSVHVPSLISLFCYDSCLPQGIGWCPTNVQEKINTIFKTNVFILHVLLMEYDMYNVMFIPIGCTCTGTCTCKSAIQFLTKVSRETVAVPMSAVPWRQKLRLQILPAKMLTWLGCETALPAATQGKQESRQDRHSWTSKCVSWRGEGRGSANNQTCASWKEGRNVDVPRLCASSGGQNQTKRMCHGIPGVERHHQIHHCIISTQNTPHFTYPHVQWSGEC